MEALFFILVIWLLLIAKSKKNTPKTTDTTRANRKTERPAYDMPSGNAQASSAGTRYAASVPAKRPAVSRPSSSTRPSQSSHPVTSNVKGKTANQIPAASTGSILDRAKENAARLKEDETLKQIEEAHNHQETDAHIEMTHSRNCQSLKNAEELELAIENELGSTEDLMVMGYSGNLQFDRDFVSEALDMLSAISSSPS